MMKPCFALAIGCSAVLLAGCGGNDAKENPKVVSSAPVAKAEMTDVWLKVDGMSKRLGITGLTGPNKVREALEGLPGVQSVVQLDHPDDGPLDLLKVRCDPSKITPEALVQAVDNHESQLKAKIVSAPGGDGGCEPFCNPCSPSSR